MLKRKKKLTTKKKRASLFQYALYKKNYTNKFVHSSTSWESHDLNMLTETRILTSPMRINSPHISLYHAHSLTVPPLRKTPSPDGAGETRFFYSSQTLMASVASSVNSFNVASIFSRAKSLMERPWTTVHLPSAMETGNEYMVPSGIP